MSSLLVICQGKFDKCWDRKQFNRLCLCSVCEILGCVHGVFIYLSYLDGMYFSKLSLLELHNLTVVDAINLAPFNSTGK